MKRIVHLGMGDGGLWLACADRELPAGATPLDSREARFWLRWSVPAHPHPSILHAISDIADALGYPFHGSAPFADMPFVMETLETALVENRLVAFRFANNEGGGQGPQPQPHRPPPLALDAPELVNPLIDVLGLHFQNSVVVVVPKTATDPTGNIVQYTHRKRRAIRLKTDEEFDGRATFSCDDETRVKFFSTETGGKEIKLDDDDNVFEPRSMPAWVPKGASISSGIIVYVEGVRPSEKQDDITITLALSKGTKPKGAPVSTKITSVELTLDLHKSSPKAATAPAFSQDDKIFVGRNLLVQKGGSRHDRAKLVVNVRPANLEYGTLLIEAMNDHVDAFWGEVAQPGEKSALDLEITPPKRIPRIGEVLWGQAAKRPSKRMRDTGFVVSLRLDGNTYEGDKVYVTAVEIGLDICGSRTKAGVDPKPLSENDKREVGRFVHVQDEGTHHGRALLIVRAVAPKDFKGTLVLEANDDKTELYPNERPPRLSPAEAIRTPHEIEYDPEDETKKNEPKELWVQGKSVSDFLRQTNYALHLKEDPRTNWDRIAITVCEFSSLAADIPRTPERTARYGNSPVARHHYVRTGLSPAHFDEDPTENEPIGLVEGSVRQSDPIKLSVRVRPTGTPVSWSVLRDTRPAPHGDHPLIAGLPDSGPPTHRVDAADPGNPLKRELLADGVGTFHVRAFVDCNGSGEYEQHIDFEPCILMIVLLFRVQGHTNTSVKNDSWSNFDSTVTNFAGTGPPSSAGGVKVRTGSFANGWRAAVHMKATVTVVGGGADGRRGLEPVEKCLLFGGWMNNERDTGANGEDVEAKYVDWSVLPDPPKARHLTSVRADPALVRKLNRKLFSPGGTAPAKWDMGPVLDAYTSPKRPNAGIGGNSVVGLVGLPQPPEKINMGLGQRWFLELWDSPSDAAPAQHYWYRRSSLLAFRFNIDFRADCVFWTSTTYAPGPSNTDKPADRLYSTVQTNLWSIRFASRFVDDRGNKVHEVPAKATLILMKDSVPRRRAKPLDGEDVETRGPTLSHMLARDARS